MNSKQMFLCWLGVLVTRHGCQFPRILKNRKNQFVIDWIARMTLRFEELIAGGAVQQRIYWVFNGITSWDDDRVRCRTCGEPKTQRRNFINVQRGYREFCCRKCANSSPVVRSKSKQTRLAANGGSYYSEQSMAKRRDTCMRRYGAPNNMQSEVGLASYRKALVDRYGVENQFQRRDVVNKIARTKAERYGDSRYNNCEQALKTVEKHA